MHLLPLVAYSGQLESTWSNIRKGISIDLLMFNTLPKESSTLMGLSFYNIIIRPMLKITDKIINQYTNESNSLHKNFIIKAIKKTFQTWLKVEKNNTTEVLNLINDFLLNGEIKNIEIFDKIIYHEAASRL